MFNENYYISFSIIIVTIASYNIAICSYINIWEHITTCLAAI